MKNGDLVQIKSEYRSARDWYSVFKVTAIEGTACQIKNLVKDTPMVVRSDLIEPLTADHLEHCLLRGVDL